MKRWGTVEKYRMPFDYIFDNLPNNRITTIDNLFRAFLCLYNPPLDKLAHYKRFVKLSCHILGQTAFVHLQLRAYDNNRTRRIVYTLTEKVLTETPLLTLKAI